MQVKKEDIQNKILETAQRLFIKRGYENTSLKQIADKSNISKSNIYRYFSSKAEIYDALVYEARNEIIEYVKRMVSDDFIARSPESKIEECSLILTRVITKHQTGIMIMLKSYRSSSVLYSQFTKLFVDNCKVSDEEFQKLIIANLISSLTVIIEKYKTADEIYERSHQLFSYHYLGINGLRSKTTDNYDIINSKG